MSNFYLKDNGCKPYSYITITMIEIQDKNGTQGPN